MARLVDQKVMKRGGRALAVPLATILLAGGVVTGCGSSKKHAAQTRSSSTATSTAQSESPRTTVAAPPAPAKRRKGAKPTRVAVMSSQYGRVLNAPGGHALYVFTHDTPGRSSTSSHAAAQRGSDRGISTACWYVGRFCHGISGCVIAPSGRK